MKVMVTHPHANPPPGTVGELVKTWVDPDGNCWVRLFLGRNLTGQKLQVSLPADMTDFVMEELC